MAEYDAKDLQSVLLYMRGRFDVGAFEEPRRMVAILMDLSPDLKRDGNVFSPVLDILRQLRIHPSGFSKYCIGSLMTNGRLKHNRFKPKMIRISKYSGAKICAAAV